MPLAELEFDHTLFDSENRKKGDEKLYVRFFSDVLPDDDATAATGMRKFRDAEMIQIMVPGSKTSIVVREVRDDDKHRFGDLYERFKAGHESVVGYPLSQWPMATRAMVEELKYVGFVTVEQVAEANDMACQRYPGLRELKARAASWLAAQRDSAPIEKLNSEVEARNAEIAALKQQMAEMAAQIAKLKK